MLKYTDTRYRAIAVAGVRCTCCFIVENRGQARTYDSGYDIMPTFADIAQLVEQRFCKPLVGSSNLSVGTILTTFSESAFISDLSERSQTQQIFCRETQKGLR